MKACKITINGKEFQARLGADAIEHVEVQFDNMSIPQLLAQKQGYRIVKAILTAAITNEDPQIKTADVHAAIKADMEAGRLDDMQEAVLELVRASGLFGKEAAKKD